MFAIVAVIAGASFFLLTNVANAASYGAKICQTSGFSCHTVTRGETWDSLFPDAQQKILAMKLNRMNIGLHRGMIIAIPTNDALTYMDVSPFQKQISPPGEKVVYVTLKELAWGAYNEQGALQNWGPVSGGKDYCPDVRRGCRSPAGSYAIYSKDGAGCFSTKFPVGRGGAPMPYCMFFHRGFAMHGSYEVPGYNASHGCVRMFVNDAKWLNEQFVGEQQVPVIIHR